MLNSTKKKKKNRSRKNGGKYGKALHKLMSNAVYGKTMENLRNRIAVKLVSNKKRLFKMDIQTKLYMSHKIFDNDLAAIRKKKVTLRLNKPVYIGICILELSKVLIVEFHYD